MKRGKRRRVQVEGLMRLEGRNTVLVALEAKRRRVHEIFIDVQTGKDAKVDMIRLLAQQSQIPVHKVSRKQLMKLSQTQHHQGVIARADPPPAITLQELLNENHRLRRETFVVLLTEVLYEQNLGAIMRSAETAGAQAVIVPTRMKQISPITARAAMGAVEYIPLIHTGLFEAFDLLKRMGVRMMGAHMSGGKPYWTVDLTGSVCLCIGGENKGLSEAILKSCEAVISIPMLGHIPSLNMSVSAGVLLMERVRQLKIGGL